jgi:hypothetical protein
VAKHTKGAASWRPTELADTPYQKARQEWEARIGATVVQAANWRLVALANASPIVVSFEAARQWKPQDTLIAEPRPPFFTNLRRPARRRRLVASFLVGSTRPP